MTVWCVFVELDDDAEELTFIGSTYDKAADWVAANRNYLVDTKWEIEEWEMDGEGVMPSGMA